jgi:outer membrane cobalamin receptor
MSSFLSFSQKSSFNVAWDISDPNGPTYKHQIPYTPYWLHASEFTLKRKNISVTYSYNFSDFRFVLGENIAANVLDAFHIHDFRLNYECFREKRPQQVWRIHLKCNNLFNQSYQVIRSFPLPGRNFEIGISLKYQS